jgi:hypothetical protein
MTSELERRKKPAAHRKSAPPARNQGQSSVEFVRRELTETEKLEFRTWRDDIDTVIGELDRMLEDGHKVSLKYDLYNGAYAAFIFADDDSDNAGYCLTGRGGNAYRALSEALYKHVVLLRGNWVVNGRTVDTVDDPDW